MKINWKVRAKNPQFIALIILSVLMPVLAYMDMSFEDLTTWQALGSVLFEMVKNPFVLGTVAVSIYNAVYDPTTAGFSDSQQALGYNKPKDDKQYIKRP